MENKTPSTINISTSTFIKLLIIFFIIVFLYLIKEVIALIFISLVLASALDPLVDWFKKFRIPRGLGIIIIYIIILSIVSAAIFLIVPPITKEIGQIATHFPVYYEKIANGIQSLQGKSNIDTQAELQKGLNALSSGLPFAVNNILSILFTFFGGVVSFLLVLVITFYLTIEENNLKKFLRAVSPSKYQPYIAQVIFRIQRKMGLWLRGQLILSLIVFALSFIGLSILGVQYALLLALIAGILEVIPFIGPNLAAIPAIFFGFLQSPLMGVLVIALYFIIQQLENHIIVPKVMGKSVDLNPLVVIVVILIGAKIGGVAGALISVPVATALSVFISDFINKKADKELKLEEETGLNE
ncbi:AI-2E family transporter [Patescibacteria group bacterium]|nr:AI-2E family transporter [Patescibacteria group bacterium]